MRVVFGIIFGLSILISCRSTEKADLPLPEREIRIVATTSIVADLVRTIGGSEVLVESLMGPEWIRTSTKPVHGMYLGWQKPI